MVQQGPIDQVWRAPADPETALFLGYAHVLVDEAAAAVLAAAGRDRAPAVAIRRSALRVVEAGPLAGTVRSSRITPEQVRLEVDVDRVGVVNAVSPLDRHPGPGERVELAVDQTRLAVLGRGSRLLDWPACTAAPTSSWWGPLPSWVRSR